MHKILLHLLSRYYNQLQAYFLHTSACVSKGNDIAKQVFDVGISCAVIGDHDGCASAHIIAEIKRVISLFHGNQRFIAHDIVGGFGNDISYLFHLLRAQTALVILEFQRYRVAVDIMRLFQLTAFFPRIFPSPVFSRIAVCIVINSDSIRIRQFVFSVGIIIGIDPHPNKARRLFSGRILIRNALFHISASVVGIQPRRSVLAARRIVRIVDADKLTEFVICVDNRAANTSLRTGRIFDA